MDIGLGVKVALDCFKIDSFSYPKAEVLTVAHDIDRCYRYEGKAYSPHIDTIEDELKRRGVKTVSVCRLSSRLKGDKSHGNAYSPEGSFARALMEKRVKALLKRGSYPYSDWEETVWGKILDSTGAKKVVAILPSRELCVACKKRGVWVTDVMHGNFSDQHEWYSETERKDEPSEWFPHSFLLWDRASESVLKWVESKGSKCNVIGSRWVIRFMLNSPEDELVKKVREKSKWYEKVNNGKKTVLVTLQWGIRNDPHLIDGTISKELEKVILETSDRINWCIRLHPSQMEGFSLEEGARFKEYYEKNLKEHAEWYETSTNPLPLVLGNCDLHVSWFSSTAHEASMIGMRSAMLDPELLPGKSRDAFFSHLVEDGFTDYVNNKKEDIIAWIDKHTKEGSSSYQDSEFEKNYQELISFLVEK